MVRRPLWPSTAVARVMCSGIASRNADRSLARHEIPANHPLVEVTHYDQRSVPHTFQQLGERF